MKIELSYNDAAIVREALRKRIEDISALAKHEESVGHKNSMVDLCNKVNAYQEVLDKFYK